MLNVPLKKRNQSREECGIIDENDENNKDDKMTLGLLSNT